MTEVPEPVADPVAAETNERRDLPWRFAIAVLSAYVVVAALCGVVWEWLWTPPAQFVQQHQLYYVDYAALRRVFDGTGLYVILAAFASALVALVVCVVTRRQELVTLGLEAEIDGRNCLGIWSGGHLFSLGELDDAS